MFLAGRHEGRAGRGAGISDCGLDKLSHIVVETAHRQVEVLHKVIPGVLCGLILSLVSRHRPGEISSDRLLAGRVGISRDYILSGVVDPLPDRVYLTPRFFPQRQISLFTKVKDCAER